MSLCGWHHRCRQAVMGCVLGKWTSESYSGTTKMNPSLCVALLSFLWDSDHPELRLPWDPVLVAAVLEPLCVCVCVCVCMCVCVCACMYVNRKSDGHKELRQDPLLYNLWIQWQVTYCGDQVLKPWAGVCLLCLDRYPPKGPPALWPQPLMWF